MRLLKKISLSVMLLSVSATSNALDVADFNSQYKAFSTYCASGKDNLNIMSDLIADNWVKDINSKKIDSSEYKRIYNDYIKYIDYGKTTIFTKKINNKPMFIFVDEKYSLCGLSPIIETSKENLLKDVENKNDMKVISTEEKNGVITNSYLYNKNIINIIKMPEKENTILNIYSTTINNMLNK